VEQSNQTPIVGVARKWHVLGFVLLAGVGAYAVAISLSLGLWRQNSPGEGLFPFLTACAVTAFALAGLAGLRGRPRVPVQADDGELLLRATVKRLAAYLIALVFYAAALDWLGFSLSTILVVVFILRMAEGYGWRTTLAIAAGTAAGCHVLFVFWLGAILPTGFLWDRLIN
jgi:putative tricarboxylic transport membrane protein